jgi:general secretion pathway protein C
MAATIRLPTLRLPETAAARLLERGPLLVCAVAALLIGVQLALIASEWFGSAERPLPTAREAGYVPADGGASSQRVDLGALVSAHLFGEAAAAPAADANVPQTSMPLVLAGVLAADEPRGGFAIVGESAAAARFFPVGATLPGGARLHSVYPDRIVIDRGGTLESLTLPKRPLAAAPLPAAPAAQPVAAADLGERMRAAVQQNPNILSNVIRAQQVMAAGRQRGFRVYPGSNPAAFSRLGLRPGDLITAVNGTNLDDPARGDEILRTLGSAPEVRVTITRNGRASDLVLDMTQLTSEAEQIVSAAPEPAAVPGDPAAPPAQPAP